MQVVLGGSTISSRVGPSLMGEYPSIDYIVQGEGEQTLLALLDSLDSRAAAPDTGGLLSRGRAPRQGGAVFSEVPHLDELPLPDYDEFAGAADKYGFDWTLSIEGSRGCGWDRATRTGNPRDTCYFCNLNVQWSGYCEKSIARIVAEIETLRDRYSNLKLFFADNIVRHHGLREFAEELKRLHKHFESFQEMRANVTC